MHQEINLDVVREVGLRYIKWRWTPVRVSSIINRCQYYGIRVTPRQVRRVLADYSKALTEEE